MEREIKFRAWDKEGNEYTNEPIGMVCMQDWLYRYSISMPMPYETNRYYFMQYTGLKDKNGVEIYEGDIVQLPESYIKPMKVYWNKEMTGFYPLLSQRADKMEVIGNIHET